jgi:hypothetical protein
MKATRLARPYVRLTLATESRFCNGAEGLPPYTFARVLAAFVIWRGQGATV